MSIHGSAECSSHRGAREGDDGGVDECQRLTEMINARRRTEEEDRGEEEKDGHSSALFDRWHDSPKNKTKGASSLGGRGRRGGTLGH